MAPLVDAQSPHIKDKYYSYRDVVYLRDIGITPFTGKSKTPANGWICRHASVVHRCVVCEVLPGEQ